MKTVALGWNLRTVAKAVDGDLYGNPEITIERVSTDTRDAQSEALFVAIVGETFDGHRFAVEALETGAAAVLVEKGSGVEVTPRIEVESTLVALAGLAATRRSELTMPVIAITGTSGKTTTKDLIAAGITGSWGSPRSFNNEIGLPLTILATPGDATALIVEIGSRGVGHIRSLSHAMRPDVSVITNLGVGHMETFGSQERLRDAKYEVVEALNGTGTAVVPAEEPTLAAGEGVRTITFGPANAAVRADIRFSLVRVDDGGLPSFTCSTPEGDFAVALGVPGLHQASNAAAALGVAVALELPLDAFIAGMESARNAAWRMEVHRGSYTIVNDAYNANPQSVASALQTVALMGGRHIAVLGPMAELGRLCQSEHVRMGELAATLGFDELVVVGADHGYEIGFGRGAVNAANIEDAADTISAIVEPGDVVLVKASRSASLERLALQLIKDSAS